MSLRGAAKRRRSNPLFDVERIMMKRFEAFGEFVEDLIYLSAFFVVMNQLSHLKK
jgi:hypothetical protein